MRLALTIVIVLLVILVGGSIAYEASKEPKPKPTVTQAKKAAPVATISERVEAIRELAFKAPPQPITVTPAQAKKDGLADLDLSYPPERRAADEALYTLVGLLEPNTSLRAVSASIFGEQVAGYYDPRTKKLALVEGATTNRVTGEMTIAHELTHALEDEVFRLDLATFERSDDPSYAYKALVEGTATRTMLEYLDEHFDAGESLGGLIADGISAPSTIGLPPFLVESLTFPYLAGNQFVSSLYERTDSWELVDNALKERPPASTEQILHPEKWVESDLPEPVNLPTPAKPGFTKLTEGVFGEWQTRQLLALGGEQQFDAAEGWAGDGYALYRMGGATTCPTPCIPKDALVMRWKYDTPKEEAEFFTALKKYVEDGLEATPVADLENRYDSRKGAIAMSQGDTGITIAFAPDLAVAQQLVEPKS